MRSDCAMTLRRTLDFALYIAVGLGLVGLIYWTSGTDFDLKSHPVWPHVALMTALAFGAQVEIRRSLRLSFGQTFWMWLSGLTIFAVFPLTYMVALVQPWPGIYSVVAGVVEAVVFSFILDRAAPARPEKSARDPGGARRRH
jgi:hypothetical protein